MGTRVPALYPQGNCGVPLGKLERSSRGLVNCTKASASKAGIHNATRVQTIEDDQRASDAVDDAPRSPFLTGGMDISTAGATSSFSSDGLVVEKTIVVVRHGMSTWNEEKKIQGSTNLSELTLVGKAQAHRCRNAIRRIHFDSCFSSPLQRAATTADIVWEGRDKPLIYLDDLKEANLGHLQGIKNDVAAKDYAEEFRTWRENPMEFYIDGRYPVHEVFSQANSAWKVIMTAPGSSHLIVTHKSILRALICTALGLPPSSFRSVDVNNGGISTFKVNKNGEPMLTGLNLTSHMHADGVYY